jgi:integrase
VPNRIHFTDITIRALKSSPAQTTYWDEAVPAFGVRIGRRSKTFLIVRDGGHRIKIGRYPAISLHDARKEAKCLLALTELPRASAVTVSQAVATFLDTRQQQNRSKTKQETERLLTRHLLPTLAGRLLTDVTTEDLVSILDGLIKKPGTANHACTAMKTFFNWAVARRHIKHSPLAGVPLPAKAGKRDRVLTDTELVAVYRAAQGMGYPFGFIILICIHTGMRRGEVGSLKWSYITPEAITLPAAATKNAQQHVIPNLIEGNLKLIPRTSEYLFPNENDAPFTDWNKSKQKIDERCGVTDWVIHDLRRTFSTKMAEWQLAPPHVIERLLNHASGTMSPLARIYNRATYLAEMRDALTAYEQRLATLISSA